MIHGNRLIADAPRDLAWLDTANTFNFTNVTALYPRLLSKVSPRLSFFVT